MPDAVSAKIWILLTLKKPFGTFKSIDLSHIGHRAENE